MPVFDLGSSFTIFGKVVIAILIQIGGLSILTLTIFVMTLLGSKIGFTNRAVLKESLNQNSLQGLVKLVKRIIIISFVIEFVGFIINLFIFIPTIKETSHAIGISAFHAIFAFNNAGLEILGMSNYFLDYNNNILFNINISMLSILGGLGVIVIYEIANKIIGNVVDYFNIKNDFDVYEIEVSSTFERVSLIDLNLRNKYKVNILLIQRSNQMITPTSTDYLQANDHIFVFGRKKELPKMVNFFSNKA